MRNGIRLCQRICLFVIGIVVSAGSAVAIDFQSGDLTGAWDTTLKYGVLQRHQERDKNNVHTLNGGNKPTGQNDDDGNLNYDKGDIVNNRFDLVTELDLSWNNYAFFTRGLFFYDFAVMGDETQRTKFSEESKKLIGTNAELYDAFIQASYAPGDIPIDIRLGRQVLNWGQSTFITNGISSANALDVNNLQIPGSELRQAYLPANMIWMNFGIHENFSIEAFYKFEYRKSRLPPSGSYFSTSDFLGEGAKRLLAASDPVSSANSSDGVKLPTSPGTAVKYEDYGDDDKDGGGDAGAAMRFTIPALNYTELGLYYVKYASTLPSLAAKSGPQSAFNRGLQTAAGQGISGNDAALLGFVEWLDESSYGWVYPEDITLMGLGFSTVLGNVAVQGEFSQQKDFPVGLNAREFLLYAYSTVLGDASPSQVGSNQGNYDTLLKGYKKSTVNQAQMTFTGVTGPMLGSAGVTLLAEIGTVQADLPERDELILGGLTNKDDFFDEGSWGYRTLVAFSYPALFWGVDFSPSWNFSHDVEGSSPNRTFSEGNKSTSLTLAFNTPSSFSFRLGYAQYMGNAQRHTNHDRDLFNGQLAYSF